MTPSRAPLGGLRRLGRPAPATGPDPGAGAPPVELCEMCSTPIGTRHGHVADLEAQRLVCACRACYLLFTGHGAGSGRYRALPEDSRRVQDPAISQGQWDALQVPVDLAFFFRRETSDSFAACYPGPGGATESLLDLTSWGEVLAANPVLAEVETDVEAVLLRRTGGTFGCYLVPIDTCYELVGRVRTLWLGFSGGQEVWAAIDSFFEGLDTRSRSVDRAGGAVARA